MRLLGFNFNKISIEKKSTINEKLKTNININIAEIKEIKQKEFKTKDEIIGVDFIYTVDYSPEFAKVELKGFLALGFEPKDAKKVLKDWKEQKMDEGFRYHLFDLILKKSTLKALELEESVNLPLHMPLFSLKRQESSQ